MGMTLRDCFEQLLTLASLNGDLHRWYASITVSTADVCFSVEKKIYRAAAFGRTVTDQAFDWMLTDSGKVCLERADAELPDVVEMYQIIHLWLPETLDSVYEDDMSLTHDQIQLLV